MTQLDTADRRILHALQSDAQMTAAELGEHALLSASQSARRRQRLEAEGFIDGYAARLNPERVGLDVQAFIQVSMTAHSPETARAFVALARARPEVVSAWTLTGEADYLLRVFCPDLPALNTLIHDVFLPHAAVARVQSQIVMDQTKPDSPLPVREN